MRKLMGFIATLLMTACMDASEVSAQTAGGGTVVRDVSIQSTVLGREMLYSVYLPAGYTSSKQYPVLYLLHGYGGDCFTCCTATVATRTTGGCSTIWPTMLMR